MPQLLTVRKQAWIKQRQPSLIRGTPLSLPIVVESRYYQKLHAMIDRMTAGVELELRKFFETPHAEEYFAEDASVASQARILTNALMRKFNDMFAQQAPDLADKQATAADKASSSALHSSLSQLSGGLSLPTTTLSGPLTDVLTATIAENVGLIKSISQQYLTGVQGAVLRSITTGNGLADLLPFLAKHKGITERRALMIARDQTRKAYNNLNRGRMENVGLKKFEWLHTGGSDHPRKLHIDYSGKVFSFDALPIIDENTGERGIPGQAINCRCRMVPVLDFGDEK
jgi:SPP1 gp7 family putative phage head morphogenesis protein